MKPYQVIAMAVVVAVLTTLLIVPIVLSGREKVPPPEPPLLTHAQETWVRALEWCESNGRPDAINEVDLDGTPSYGAFQFKPGTLDYYGEIYGVIAQVTTEEEIKEMIMSRDLQYAIVEKMVADRDNIRWDRQFPWCVKKLGWPPKATQ